MCLDRHTHTHTFRNTAPSLCLMYIYGQIDSNPDSNISSKPPQCSKRLAWLQSLLRKAHIQSFQKQNVFYHMQPYFQPDCHSVSFLPPRFIRNENSMRPETVSRSSLCPVSGILLDPNKHSISVC